jgi:hypothetical protein
MNTSPKPVDDPEPPVQLHVHAMDNLRFIRETMERSTAFTAVPGWGTVATGMIGLLGAFAASQTDSQRAWFMVWMATAACGFTSGVGAMILKANAIGEPIFSGPGRRFALGMLPTILAAVALTIGLYNFKLHFLMPSTWLLLYGAAVVTGGAHSVKVVPLMGLSFMVLGIFSLALPAAWGNAFMAAGFGVVHIIFGIIVARKYGG